MTTIAISIPNPLNRRTAALADHRLQRAGWITYLEEAQQFQPAGEWLRYCTPFAEDLTLDALVGLAKVNDEAHVTSYAV
jgi:hypothetical protein